MLINIYFTSPFALKLNAEELKTLEAWIKAGKPEKKQTTTGSTDNSTDTNALGYVTEYRIKAGTGAKAWNTADSEIVLKVGTTFTLHNDDSIAHQIHTEGAPFAHPAGPNIAPGKNLSFRVTREFKGPSLREHIQIGPRYGDVFIRAIR